MDFDRVGERRTAMSVRCLPMVDHRGADVVVVARMAYRVSSRGAVALTVGAFAFEPTDRVARQREHLAVVGEAIESSAAAYEAGEWLSTHLARRRLSEPILP